MEPRVGVYICHCGSNIAGTVDTEEVSLILVVLLGTKRIRRLFNSKPSHLRCPLVPAACYLYILSK